MLDRTTRTIQKYNKVAEMYAKKIEDRIPKKELDTFIKLLPVNGKVLEIGSAAGRDTHYLHDKGIDVTGIDLSEELTKIAREKNPDVTYQIIDMRKLPYKNSSFDGVWANAVFHHLEKSEMKSTLHEWFRVIKNKGILYLSTKMGEGNWQGKDSLSVGQEREFTFLMPEELEKMFHKMNVRKLSQVTEKDQTRNLYWIQAFYKK